MMGMGVRMKEQVRQVLSKDFATVSKEELQLLREEYTMVKESMEESLVYMRADFDDLVKLHEVVLKEGNFKKVLIEWEYEKDPVYQEIKYRLQARRAEQDINQKSVEIRNEEDILEIVNQLLMKIDLYLK